MRMLLPALLVALTAIVSPQPTQPPIIGRWDITVQRADGSERSAWLEVRHSGVNTLVGQFVGMSGSARPIAKVEFTNGEMRFAIPPQWERVDGDVVVSGTLSGDRLTGTMAIGSGAPMKWTGVRAPSLRRASAPRWDAPVPLFNGRDLSGWHIVGGSNEWEAAEGGVLRNRKSGGNLVTDATFDDFKLHAEFRYPAGGNSGIYLRGRYEVQIADVAGAEPEIDSLGAIYGYLAPSVMAARKPGEWQSFDVTLIGRHVTVALNGTTIIADREIPGITGAALDSHEGKPGPLLLQGDHGPIEYRNLTLARGK
ncbi:MAG TPA: DUF1080 domain-containing protein [Vicinamibacterales bacterium]|nr:DUF1080 domain-containing protein [Vicinamibacterales bacterium]